MSEEGKDGHSGLHPGAHSAPDSRLWPWLLALGLVRVWMAFGIRSWSFPDEWFHTLGFADLLLGNPATYVQEIGLHLRNLSWPWLLTLPLRLTRAIAPESTALPFGLAHTLAGLLDLFRVWATWTVLRQYARGRWIHVGMAMIFLTHFNWIEGVRLHTEHLSSIALWVSLALLVREKWVGLGVGLVAIGALRYPSGVLSAGLLLGLALQKKKRPLALSAIGIALGLVLFGLADWIYYGRPWESLWMYLQYNVLTGKASEAFGHQGIEVYLGFLRWHWIRLGFNAPLAAALLLGWALGIRTWVRAREPWLVATVVYIAGHCLIGHKEERFVLPVEPLLIFGGWLGLGLIRHRAERWKPALRATLLWGARAILAANLLLSLQPVLLGDRLKYQGSLLELRPTVRAHDACGVIHQQLLPAPAIPSEFAVGLLTDQRILWHERAPQCRPGQKLLLALPQRYSDSIRMHCALVPGGYQLRLPESLYQKGLERGWFSTVWAACEPAQLQGLLGHAVTSSVEHPFVRGFKKHQHLPGFGTSGQALVELGLTNTPHPDCGALCWNAPVERER